MAKKASFLVLILVLLLLVTACAGQPPEQMAPQQIEDLEEQERDQARASADPGSSLPDPDVETMPVTLHYFVNGRDHTIEREIPRTEGVARAMVEELHRSAAFQGGTFEVIPPGTQLLDVEIMDQIAYLDLSRDFRDNHWGGVEAEVNTVYSIVHTLTQFPQVEAVQFLVEGRQIETIAAGAVNLKEPVRPLKFQGDPYAPFFDKVRDTVEGTLTWPQLVQREGTIGLSSRPDDLAWGDLTGDGVPELALIQGKRLTVWGEGDQGYQQVWETWLAAPGQVTLADTAGQGWNDVVAYTDNHIYIFGYTGEGFQQRGWQGVAARITGLTAGDTTGDGKEELILLYGRGDPFGDDYRAAVEIWQYRDQAYVKAFEAGDMPFRRIEAADISGNGRAEIVAFYREGLTAFSWNGKAYVEIYKNPAIGGFYSTMDVADLTGDGRMEVVLGDGMGTDIYVYTWEKDGLVKVWQTGNIMGDVMASPLRTCDLTGDGRAEILVPTQADGGFLLFAWDGQSFTRYVIGESSGGEEILALLPGTNRLLYTQRQLASSPQYQVFLGRFKDLNL